METLQHTFDDAKSPWTVNADLHGPHGKLTGSFLTAVRGCGRRVGTATPGHGNGNETFPCRFSRLRNGVRGHDAFSDPYSIAGPARPAVIRQRMPDVISGEAGQRSRTGNGTGKPAKMPLPAPGMAGARPDGSKNASARKAGIRLTERPSQLIAGQGQCAQPGCGQASPDMNGLFTADPVPARHRPAFRSSPQPAARFRI